MFDIHSEGLHHYAVLTENGHEHYFCAQGAVTLPDGRTQFIRLDTGVVVEFPADSIVKVIGGYSLLDTMLQMDDFTEHLRHAASRENSLSMVVTASTQILYAV